MVDSGWVKTTYWNAEDIEGVAIKEWSCGCRYLRFSSEFYIQKLMDLGLPREIAFETLPAKENNFMGDFETGVKGTPGTPWSEVQIVQSCGEPFNTPNCQ